MPCLGRGAGWAPGELGRPWHGPGCSASPARRSCLAEGGAWLGPARPPPRPPRPLAPPARRDLG
eukprot:6761388-Alexandrium_andersonii.AAC.1